MKTSLIRQIAACTRKAHLGFLASPFLLGLALPALANSDLSLPWSGDELTAVNDNKNTDYGPPAAVLLHPSDVTGPLTFKSGEVAGVYAASGASKTDSLLLVLSLNPKFLSDGDFIQVNLYDISMNSLGTVTFGARDFYSDKASGFTEKIDGIGNGQVGGITFTGSSHAAADVSLANFPAFKTGAQIASLSVLSPVDLRLDVVGLSTSVNEGLASALNIPDYIINNSPNSGAIAIQGGGSVPAVQGVPDGGSTAVLLGLGMIGMATVARRRVA